VSDRSGSRANGAGAIPAGSWVEIQQVVLRPGERAPNVPSDTAGVDFVARIRGFLMASAPIGDDATVRTLLGREVSGTLTAVNPRNPADYGNPVPELLQLGVQARRALDELGSG
jgi:2-amino-4-ketopentanoate thiolase alpha subunit